MTEIKLSSIAGPPLDRLHHTIEVVDTETTDDRGRRLRSRHVSFSARRNEASKVTEPQYQATYDPATAAEAGQVLDLPARQAATLAEQLLTATSAGARCLDAIGQDRSQPDMLSYHARNLADARDRIVATLIDAAESVNRIDEVLGTLELAGGRNFERDAAGFADHVATSLASSMGSVDNIMRDLWRAAAGLDVEQAKAQAPSADARLAEAASKAHARLTGTMNQRAAQGAVADARGILSEGLGL